jgi:hypothetical protein
MIYQWGFCFLSGVGFLLSVSGSTPKEIAGLTKDEKLVSAIQSALKHGIGPAKVEAAVGKRATLNTVRKGDRDPFEHADIAPDRDSGPALPDRKTIRHAAYWVRPIEGRNPKLVGIVWPKTGKPQIFFGELLPPG